MRQRHAAGKVGGSTTAAAAVGRGATVVVTGANQGIGFEACKQLADVSSVKKIVLTCRSKAKAETAIAKLVELTGKDPSLFGYVVLDLDDYASVTKAAAALPDQVDRICLNAGNLVGGMADSGVTKSFGPTLGHWHLMEKLFEAKKVAKGARVIYISTELTRTIIPITYGGFTPIIWGFAEKDIDPAMHADPNGATCNVWPLRAQMGSYGRAKIVGTLAFKQMAKEHPEVYFASTSPGAAPDTELAKKAYFPMSLAATYVPWAFICIGVGHTVAEGAARYIAALTDADFPNQFPSGASAYSGKTLCCFWGAKGPLADNDQWVPYLRNPDLAVASAKALREEVKKWSMAAPGSGKMAR